ncbi:MAG: prepilin peptidase [Patescibacteria group bacterium]|nr:prepilin peptidase [Patescibacteria group bacterium]
MDPVLPLLFVIGVCVGSFLNVLIDRLPVNETILGRSHCDHCKRSLQWYELIPVVSFFILSARCRTCKTKLSYFYPFIEVLTGAVFVLGWVFFPVDFLAFAYPNLKAVLVDHNSYSISVFLAKAAFLGILCTIIVMFFADLKYYIIPDWMQLAFAYFALMLFFIREIDFERIVYRMGAGIVLLLPLLAIYLYTKGRGIGFGDVKLAWNLGFFMGIIYGMSALYLAFIGGAVVGGVLILLRRKKMKSKVPFGPFILAGVLITIFAFPWVNYLMYLFYGVELLFPL